MNEGLKPGDGQECQNYDNYNKLSNAEYRKLELMFI